MNKSILFFCIFFIINNIQSQSNNLTGSPYSLFGVGVESNTNTGINSGMGQVGIALTGGSEINLFNPASFASIDKQRTIYDVGFFGELKKLYSNGNEENRITSNFSNIAFGFNGNGNYGIGISVNPITSVGYILAGIENNIEGSTDNFITNFRGSGGLNEIRFDYGKRILSKLNAGLKLSYVFGNIKETETIIAQGNIITNENTNNYNGAILGLGVQYKHSNSTTFGFIADFPTSLSGRQDTNSKKVAFNQVTILDETIDKKIDAFKLPLKLGIGFSSSYKNLSFAADYTTRFWENTNQNDGIADYKDQHVIALGLEYIINPRSTKYLERVKLRSGFNFDGGYLLIDDKKVNSYELSFGLGLPLGKGKGSILNISYNFNNNSTTDDFLIREASNTININLTLSSIWFKKILID